MGRAGQPAAQDHQMRAAQDHEMEESRAVALARGPCLLAAALRLRPIRAVRVAPGPALGPGSTPLAGRLVHARGANARNRAAGAGTGAGDDAG